MLTFGGAKKNFSRSAESDNVVSSQFNVVDGVWLEVFHLIANVGRIRNLVANQSTSFDKTGRCIPNLSE